MASDYEVTHIKSILTKKQKKNKMSVDSNSYINRIRDEQRNKQHQALAEKIYEALVKAGAGIGNMSIQIIKKILDNNN